MKWSVDAGEQTIYAAEEAIDAAERGARTAEQGACTPEEAARALEQGIFTTAGMSCAVEEAIDTSEETSPPRGESSAGPGKRLARARKAFLRSVERREMRGRRGVAPETHA